MTDRVCLVTGASRGIGGAIAERLATSGFHVVLNHRASGETATAVAEKIRGAGGSASVMQADVTDLGAVRRMIADIRQQFGRLDVLVNNAGRWEGGFLLLMPPERWWAVVQDNVGAVVNCTRVALPLLLASRPSTIINISSISGVRGTEGVTAYSAAKAAIIGFTKALARELGPKGVSINCIAPGAVDTEMYRIACNGNPDALLAGLPIGRIGRPAEVAEVAALLAGGKAAFLHGQVITIDGGRTM